jgi:hypothetical protein
MEVRIYRSHQEADEAEDAYYASLSPKQRVDILLQMIADYRESLGEAGQRLERVCRVTTLAES